MSPEIKILVIYIAVMTIAAFLMCGIDKFKARRNLWRIPERVLLLAAAAGGSMGLLTGMYVFRHKTLHKKFTVGVPVIIAIQMTAAVVMAVCF